MEFHPSKSIKVVPEEPKTYQRPRRRYKQWKSAKNAAMGKVHAIQNMFIEQQFMMIRTEVRKLYAQHNEYFYDHDIRHDTTESDFGMHIIACSSFFMNLDCNLCYQYEVQYDITSSPFKEEIAALIHKGPIHTIGKSVPQQPSMAAYFEHMRTYWKDDAQFFSYLSLEKELSAD